ncbi:MAG: PH domain-containing protein [Clostridia bacterium]|nr:PH domain-containing protein [Clostridia bacterium]
MSNSQPEFIAKKSIWRAITPFRVLFCWLIIPLLLMLADIIKLKCQSIEFYNDYIVQKICVIAKNERKSAFMGIISVSVSQSVGGRIFGYGDITVDVVGKWDINTKAIASPERLKRYLESKMVNRANYQNTTMFVA